MSEEKEVVEFKEIEEPKEIKKVSGKVNKASHWNSFFSKNYKDLPIELSTILGDYFDNLFGEEYEVDAKLDNRFQRDVINQVIEYSKGLSKVSGKSWHEHYSELIVNFSNKSIGNIINSKEE